jgi:hypothetical protein
MTDIKLVKPTPEQNTRRYDERRKGYVGEGFDRGERIIMVDGVRWGRTIVTMHGCHGTKHVFYQDGGEIITADRGRHTSEIAIRSEKRQKWLGDKDTWRPTEERVLEKARELVATGKLRHPDVVKKESVEAMKQYDARVEEREKERVAEFRAKAMEAAQVNDPDSPIIDRVVAAMEWAQSR